MIILWANPYPLILRLGTNLVALKTIPYKGLVVDF